MSFRPCPGRIVGLTLGLCLVFSTDLPAQCGEPAAVGDLRSTGDGLWNAPLWEEWDGGSWVAAASPPSASSSGTTTICAGDEITVAADSARTLGGMGVVAGSLGGGNAASTLMFSGTSFANTGSIADLQFYFAGPEATWSGSGSWTDGLIQIQENTSIGNSVTIQADLTVQAGDTLSLDGDTLTVDGLTSLRTLAILGALQNPGILVTSDSVELSGAGVWNAPLLVSSGFTLADSSLRLLKSLEIASGADFRIATSDTVTVAGNVLNNGSLTSTFTAFFFFEGDTLVNNDSLGAGLIIRMLKTGNQVITGTDVWGPQSFEILDGSITRLSGNVTFRSTGMTIRSGAALDLGGDTLTFEAPDVVKSITVIGGGILTNPGLLVTSGTVSLSQTGSWNAPLMVSSGVTRAFSSLTFNKDVEIAGGAELKVHDNQTVGALGDVLNNGLLSGGILTTFEFQGDTLTNNDSLDAALELVMTKAGTQVIEGSGVWTPQIIIVQDGSTTRLHGNQTFRSMSLQILAGGSLELGGNTLSFEAPDLGKAITALGTLNNPGLLKTSGTVTLSGGAGDGWDVPLLVSSGVTKVITNLTFLKDVETASGGELLIEGNRIVTFSSHVLNDGILSGVNTNSFLVFSGDSLVNNATAMAVGNVLIKGPGRQVLDGNGAGSIGKLRIQTPDTLDNVADQMILENVTFQQGIANLKSGNLDLGLNGHIISESDSSRFIGGGGTVSATRVLNAPNLDPGFLGVTIMSAANLDTTTIVRGHAQQVLGGSEDAILRYFDISPKNNSGLNGTLVFDYFDAELAGVIETEIEAFKSTDGGVNWAAVGAVVDENANTATVSGLDSFSRWTLGGPVGCTAVCLVGAKIFLEGPYESGSMSTALSSSGLVPLDQPYDSTLYDGTTREYDVPAAVGALPVGTVDWLLLTVRTGTGSGSSVDTALAFVLNDGSIVDIAGSDTVVFSNAPADSLYLVSRHRNHIGVMSSSKLDFVGSQIDSWDFTTAMSQAFTTGPSPMKDLGDGSFGMFVGDYSLDELITVNDFALWLVDTKAAAMGYLVTDGSFDGHVTISDFAPWLVNTKAGASSQVP